MNIGLLSFYTPEWQDLADITLGNKRRYCFKHKYQHIIKVGPYSSPDIYYAVDRLKYIRDLFSAPECNLTHLFVLNIGTLVMNPHTKVEQFLTQKQCDHCGERVDLKDFYITEAWNGLNAGTFIIRNSDWSLRWLNCIIDRALVINHPWHEQQAMIEEYRNPEWASNIEILPHPSINSMYYDLYGGMKCAPQHFKKGDFILHTPGRPKAERIDIFTSDRVKEDMVQ